MLVQQLVSEQLSLARFQFLCLYVLAVPSNAGAGSNNGGAGKLLLHVAVYII